MRNSKASLIAVAGLMAAASMPAASGEAFVIRREGYDLSRSDRRASFARSTSGGYPGAKLAKKARKGTLTHNGIR
jgi:hypothetical protein